MSMTVRFWGVRGSVPSPISNAEIEKKEVAVSKQVFRRFLGRNDVTPEEIRDYIRTLPFSMRANYGGNTTCVEVRCGNELIILDMGTGLRELGNHLLAEGKTAGLRATILQSHV